MLDFVFFHTLARLLLHSNEIEQHSCASDNIATKRHSRAHSERATALVFTGTASAKNDECALFALQGKEMPTFTDAVFAYASKH